MALTLLLLLQAPAIVLSPAPRSTPVSPLELAAAAAVAQWPKAEAAATAALLPGAWMKHALVPSVACALKKEKSAACDQARQALSDPAAVAAAADLPSLATRLSAARDAPLLAAGSALLAASALLGRIFSSRSAVVGVVLFAVGVVRGGHAALPPLWMMAFLAMYSAFGEAAERRVAMAAMASRRGGSAVLPAKERARQAAERAAAEAEKEEGGERKAGGGGKEGGGGSGSTRKKVSWG